METGDGGVVRMASIVFPAGRRTEYCCLGAGQLPGTRFGGAPVKPVVERKCPSSAMIDTYWYCTGPWGGGPLLFTCSSGTMVSRPAFRKRKSTFLLVAPICVGCEPAVNGFPFTRKYLGW